MLSCASARQLQAPWKGFHYIIILSTYLYPHHIPLYTPRSRQPHTLVHTMVKTTTYPCVHSNSHDNHIPLYPQYHIADLHTAGGLPILIKELLDAGLLHGDCLTVTGKTVTENLASVSKASDLTQDVVYPFSKPSPLPGTTLPLSR